jgi:hypothetical protein
MRNIRSYLERPDHMANPQATALVYTVVSANYDSQSGGSGDESPASTFSSAQAQLVAGVGTGVLVAAFFDGESQRGRNFIPGAGAMASQWNGATGAAAGTGIVTGQLYGSSTNANIVFPYIVSATLVNDSAGNPTGPLKLVLAPAPGDLFNASSVMTYWLDQSAVIITVSGTF